CDSWKMTCRKYKSDLTACPKVDINFKGASSTKTSLISGACMVQGSDCIESTVAYSTPEACK
ncbi:MAG: hypothetical protein MJ156_02400, partial [Alphaproteobacteria bacterium]|nr:hypothetical protein [Alphaproteobacteria bacterium]